MSLSFYDELVHLPPPPRLPNLLPSAHLTRVTHFPSIARSVTLTPHPCNFLGENLIYLSYGTPLYRTSHEPTSEENLLPIALLFKAELAHSVDVIYPFDSGAFVSNLYGSSIDSLRPIQRWSVDKRDVASRPSEFPRLLVYHLYNDNTAYVRGTPAPPPPAGSSASELDVLREFLRTKHPHVDKRQRAIELVFRRPLSLRDVIWIGIPDRMDAELFELRQALRPDPPEVHRYDWTEIFRPGELESQLEHEATKTVRRYIEG